MRPSSRKAIRPALALALVALAAIAALLSSGSEEAPAQQTAVTIDLCADESEGGLTLPGPGGTDVDVEIWGFSLDTGSGCGPPALPGPVLDVNVDDVVTVNLHNNLSEPLSIVFPGQDLIPHTVVVPAGGTDSYTFTASNPGTHLYEADTSEPGTSAAVQVAMGLYGALIVRPATGAYGTGTEYETEEILVLSEIDPNLNNYPSGPNDFDFVGVPDEYTGGYHPTYFLINGEAYPDTDAISVADGDRVLLRYLNAGLSHHTMTLLGEHQRVIAKDAHRTDNPFDAIAETIPSGSTLDTIATLDTTDPGDRLPLYSRQLNVTNNGAYPGGMLTFIEVP